MKVIFKFDIIKYNYYNLSYIDKKITNNQFQVLDYILSDKTIIIYSIIKFLILIKLYRKKAKV